MKPQWLDGNDLALHIMKRHFGLDAICSGCGSSEEKHQCLLSPGQIIGKRIYVRWFEDDRVQWFGGMWVPLSSFLQFLTKRKNQCGQVRRR